MYKVPGNCTPLGWQTTEGSPGRTWQAWGGSFLLLLRRHALSSRWLWTFNHNTCENRLEEVQGSDTSSLFTPARLGHWQSQTASVCSKTTGQWSDRCAMSDRKTLSPPGPMSYLSGLALRIWTSFWRREDFDGMDMWNAPIVQSRQPFTYMLMESVGLGGPRWHGNSWQRGIAVSGSSQPSTLMIDIPGDLVWDLPCVQQASYLEGAHWCGRCPCTCTLIKQSDYDMMMSSNSLVFRLQAVYFLSTFFYKDMCCGYPLELHRLVDAIQMSTHNICFYKVKSGGKKKKQKKIPSH